MPPAHASVPTTPLQIHSIEMDPIAMQWANSDLFSYDAILQLLEDIETGALEDYCTEEDLERICYLLAHLARAGVLPNDTNDELKLVG